MATEKRSSNLSSEQRSCSVFDLQSNFFDSCRPFLENINPFFSLASDLDVSPANEEEGKSFKEEEEKKEKETERKANPRWSCNTCKAEFDSLQDQRSHFKSDFHRFNVKLSVAGKDTVKEDEFGEMTGESFLKDYDISSISGSEDEMEKGNTAMLGRVQERVKQKLFIQLQSGDIVSIWRCLIFNESEDLLLENNKFPGESCGLRESELAEKLHSLIHEPRDKTHLRIVLLASGGHFAGCVFDGTHIEAHKTFHRYVVRAKAGKKQSSKDATGKAANSAGASLRRHNEIALKKDIQELVAAWRPYFDASLCVFIHAPSSNRQLFFDGEKPLFSHQNCAIRNIPLTVRRPTLKEAKRIYNHLTNIVYELDEKLHLPTIKEDLLLYPNDAGKNHQESNEEQVSDQKEINQSPEVLSGVRNSGLPISAESEVVCTSLCTRETTALHEAARSGDAERTLELLEQGLDPCIKDERGRTPYMLATEKEVRNTFRRFMALNLDKWDWHAADVPTPLTKEMEESQAAKQAEKDAKRKAKSKELKKLRKVKEKAQAQAAASHNSSAIPHGQGAVAVSAVRGQSNSNSTAMMSKEEELKQGRTAEREKRAAAAEERIAALNGLVSSTTTSTSTTPTQDGLVSSANTSTSTAPLKTEGADLKCSCCMASLAGKVPFHRYHYKYCSTSCMHVHREMLEDG